MSIFYMVISPLSYLNVLKTPAESDSILQFNEIFSFTQPYDHWREVRGISPVKSRIFLSTFIKFRSKEKLQKILHWIGTYLIWFSSASYSIWKFFRLERLTIKIPPERKLTATKFLSIHIGLRKVCLLTQLVSPRGKNFHSSILLVKSSRTLCYKQRFQTTKIKSSWWN